MSQSFQNNFGGLPSQECEYCSRKHNRKILHPPPVNDRCPNKTKDKVNDIGLSEKIQTLMEELFKLFETKSKQEIEKILSSIENIISTSKGK